MKTTIDATKSHQQDWKGFYTFAGIACLTVVVLGLLDIALSMTGGEARENTVIPILEWFALFQSNAFEAFRLLGLFNILNLLLAIPLYIALHNLHKPGQAALATFSMVLFFIGAAVYISSNSVFQLFTISRQYAAADEATKAMLELIGKATLSQGADLTPGTFMGFILNEVAGILMAFVLLRGGIFSKATAWIGMIGLSLLVIFNVIAAFTPSLFSAAMIVAIPGGLLSMAYYIMLALRLFKFGKK